MNKELDVPTCQTDSLKYTGVVYYHNDKKCTLLSVVDLEVQECLDGNREMTDTDLPVLITHENYPHILCCDNADI